MSSVVIAERKLVLGAEACAYGALYAGCNFYAGYPITPATEILETLAVELPRRDGVFIQMEDEIASLAAVIGAAWGGAKAMTATSGPGFSLMQEGIGYAAITETPCVIVDAQRWGPSTGQPTRASQGDVLQAIWGTHGDHPVIVLTASSVREVYEMMVTAFNYAERYRVPVIFLLDEILAHLREAITIPEPGELEVIDRRPSEDLDGFRPFLDEAERMVNLGEGLRFAVSGLAHDAEGFPVKGRRAEEMLKRIVLKIREKYADEILRYRGLYLEDAEVLLISYGTVSRVAEAALEELRAGGLRVGLLDLKTLWPFPRRLIAELAHQPQVELIVVPELNLGQLIILVEAAAGDVPVMGVNRVDGYLLRPEEIVAEVERGLRAGARG